MSKTDVNYEQMQYSVDFAKFATIPLISTELAGDLLVVLNACEPAIPDDGRGSRHAVLLVTLVPLVPFFLKVGALFPAAVHPEPLTGVFPDEYFDGVLAFLGGSHEVFSQVTRSLYFDRWKEFEGVFPRCVAGHGRGVQWGFCTEGYHGGAYGGPAGSAEKCDGHGVFPRTLIVEEADEFSFADVPHDFSTGRILFCDGYSHAFARGGYHAVEARIVEFPHDNGGLMSGGHCSGAHPFPVAQVRADDEAAAGKVYVLRAFELEQSIPAGRDELSAMAKFCGDDSQVLASLQQDLSLFGWG